MAARSQFLELRNDGPHGSGEPVDIVWHPVRPVVAVLVRPNEPHGAPLEVHIYDTRSAKWETTLTHTAMTKAGCIAWAPLGETIAVGCEKCIVVWRMNVATGTWWAFEMSAQFPVRSLSWSPTARHIACASFEESSIFVHDVVLRTTTRVECNRPRLLEWAPNGKHLFVSSEGGFTIFEGVRWNAVSFDFPGTILAITWMPDSQRLVFALDHVEKNDRVYAEGEGGAWVPASVEEVRTDKTIVVKLDGQQGDTLLRRNEVHADRPICMCTIRSREDTLDFSVEFESADLPPSNSTLSDLYRLTSASIKDLSWSSDGSKLLAVYFIDGPAALGAVVAYPARTEPFVFAPARVLDAKRTDAPPRGEFWPGGGATAIATVSWGEGTGLLTAEPRLSPGGFALYVS